MKSFIVGFWSNIFGALKKISVFELVLWLVPRRFLSYGFIDAWVLAHFFLSIISLAFICTYNQSLVRPLLVAYAAMRIVEVTVYQINAILFDAYRWAKSGGISSPLKSYRRTVILILQNYVEMIFWFAGLYSYFASHFVELNATKSSESSLATFVGALFHSVETMATLEPTVTPADNVGRWLTILHIFIGLFVGIVVLGTVINILPQRPSLDDYFGNPEDAK